MKEELSGEMESRIIEAATRVFVIKGKAGASMQDIADEAGINRTLLNYYFRKKEKLFDLVFEMIFNQFVPGIINILTAEFSFLEKIDPFVDHYFDTLEKNPAIPLFILQELSTNPGNLVNKLKGEGVNPEAIVNQIKREMELGILKKEDPFQVFVNLISLVVFPFAGKPMLQGLLFSGNAEEMNRFIKERRIYIKKYLKESLIN